MIPGIQSLGMSQPPNFYRIKARELRDVIKNAKRWDDYLIIDVRDGDYAGGNIPGCLHVPSRTFDRDVDDLVIRCKDVKNIVFTCYHSQERGPLCARKFKDIRDTLIQMDREQPIMVLGGGMARFISYFANDPKYIENFDASLWDVKYKDPAI